MNWNYFCIFNLLGKIPSKIDSLKITASGLEISVFISLSSLIGILKGTVDFPFLKEVIMSSISLCVIGKTKKRVVGSIIQIWLWSIY